jgi:hypothetical protein
VQAVHATPVAFHGSPTNATGVACTASLVIALQRHHTRVFILGYSDYGGHESLFCNIAAARGPRALPLQKRIQEMGQHR